MRSTKGFSLRECVGWIGGSLKQRAVEGEQGLDCWPVSAVSLALFSVVLLAEEMLGS